LASCDLNIILDDDNNSYKIGGTIRGRVSVVLDKPCKCKAVVIQLAWQTRGSGSEDQHTVSQLSLFDGELLAGEHQFEFEFKVENQPLSYHGKLINIDWQLKASADIPWALDLKAMKEIVIERDRAVVALSSDHQRINLDESEAKEGSLAWFAVEMRTGFEVFVYILVALFFILWLSEYAIWAIAISIVVLVVGALLAFLHFKPQIAQTKLGKVNVEIEEVVYRAGDKLTVDLSFSANKTIKINCITTRLVVLETAVKFGLKNTPTEQYQKVAAEQRQVLQQTFTSDKAFRQSVELLLPDDAMHNFNYQYNKLAWSVELDIDIAGWPSWQKSLPIVVGA
jgi:hypothetical protein